MLTIRVHHGDHKQTLQVRQYKSKPQPDGTTLVECHSTSTSIEGREPDGVLRIEKDGYAYVMTDTGDTVDVLGAAPRQPAGARR